MPEKQLIYNTYVSIPDAPPGEEIEGYGLPESEQFWRRKDLPDIFNEVDIGKNGDVKLNAEQKNYAKSEVHRCLNGYWIFIKGVKTFIPPKYYFYLQWWKLEDDIYPDYRDADRRYFLFLRHWEGIKWCLGVARGKKRREGASSQATSNLIYECIFYTSSNCGLVSKSQQDSRDTFTDMVSFGYNQLPVFLKPRQLNRADSVTELVFAVKAEKSDNYNKGQRSKVNYRAPSENAYDRGRMSRVLADEGGKFPIDVKFSKFISKLSKTLIKGAKRVGFCEAPSTVNELTKAGGIEFKVFWDDANQITSGGRKTPNRFVTYFTPAYDNYEGFIDKYGQSVIDEPTEEQFNYLVNKWVEKDPVTGESVSEISEEDIRKGALKYVFSRREGLKGELLEEEIRQNPTTVQEMFEAANIGCAFNSFNINKRIKELKENPIPIRNITFYRDEDTQLVRWRDSLKEEEAFHWKISQLPANGNENKWVFQDGLRRPAMKDDGAISVDSYSNSQGGRRFGSKACALIGRKNDLLDPENTGRVIGMLYGRPSEKDMLHNQVLLAAEFYGYTVWYEHTSDDYDGYFKDRGRRGYLGVYPKSLIDYTKNNKHERHRGTPITPFSLTKQMDIATSFFENHTDKIDFIEILENAILFDPENRTKFDIMVSFLILLTVLSEKKYHKPIKSLPLISVYN